jgi:NAD-reducing hydrogenase small subunit
MTHKPKLKLATTSLTGCFGCHMSFLDMDERIVELLEHIEFDRSPFTDIKQLGHCDIGLIEGGACNAENVHVLRTYRANCRILVAVGACAINGGVPAMRNHFSLKECLEEVYLKSPDMINPHIPNDPELPLLLDKVYPVHEVIKIDYFLPGCPPSADTFYRFLSELIEGKEPQIGKVELRYD